MDVNNEKYLEKFERCTLWVQKQQASLSSSVDYSTEEDFKEAHSSSPAKHVSSSKDIKKRRPRNTSLDEDFSELSEISYQSPKKTHLLKDDNRMDTSSNEIPKVKSKKPIPGKEEILDLHCGWRHCTYNTAVLADFVRHVADHIPQLEVKCNEDENEEVYACLWELCNFETPNADEVTRHVNFHAYHTKVKCVGANALNSSNLPKCNFGADSVNLVPDLPKPLECLWNECGLTSNNPNVFYDHVAFHAMEIPVFSKRKNLFYKCFWRGCKGEKPNRATMVEHLRSHSKERVCACPTCGVLYSSRMRLIDHIKRQAPDECMTYQCTHCSRYYPSERILRDHMRHHVNNFKCQFCDMTCPTPHTLSLHIRQRHIDVKPFSCDYCDYKAKTQYNLKRHMAVHSTTDSLTCEEEGCSYTCRTLNMLSWHYRKKHESPPVYCCHMCDSRFARGAYLSKHLMKKHNFRWPSGHTRFRFYRNHEDGLFRLQTVRYESLEVVEDINRGDGEQTSVLENRGKFNILKEPSTNGGFEASFIVREGSASDDDPDDPDPLASDAPDDRDPLASDAPDDPDPLASDASESPDASNIVDAVVSANCGTNVANTAEAQDALNTSGAMDSLAANLASSPNVFHATVVDNSEFVGGFESSNIGTEFMIEDQFPSYPNKTVLISIDEVDDFGNIVHSKTMEVQELTELTELESARVVTDGICLF